MECELALAIETKKILIVLGIGVLIIVTLLAAAVGWALYSASENSRAYEAKEAEGREFGKTTDQNGCMKEGLSRAKAATTFEYKRGQINSAFVRACLESSRPVPGFCDGMPQRSLTNPDADYDWITEQCDKIGMDHIRTGCIA